MIDHSTSEKLRIASCLSIIAVIFIHTYYPESVNWKLTHYSQSFSNILFRVTAVPSFYIISGYLFIIHADNLTVIYKKQKKRIRTLLIPYLSWSLFFLLFLIVLSLLPMASRFLSSNILTILGEHTIGENIRMIFWDPLAFHLWFIRDLLIVVVVSPLIYYLLKKVPYVYLLILLIAGCLNILPFDTAFFFFSFGGFLCLKRCNLEIKPYQSLFFGSSLLLILLSFFSLYGPYDLMTHFSMFLSLLAAIVLWSGVTFLYHKQKSLCDFISTKMAPYTFFIYCFHEPTLNIFKKFFPYLLGPSMWVYFWSYILIPFLVILLSVGVAKLFKSCVPGLYNLMLGGR